MIHDAHCHFFSRRFFETLARDKTDLEPGDPASAVTQMLGWEPQQSVDDHEIEDQGGWHQVQSFHGEK